MSERENKRIIGASLVVVAILLVVVAILINITNGDTTGDITVSGSSSVTGIKCIDTKVLHPVFADVQPISHTNTIVANFVSNKLSSIMYKYEGIYKSEEEASNAKVLAEADYNLILANEYGAKIDVFSHTFMTDGTKLLLTIADNTNEMTSKTSSYFLLDIQSNFPSTLEELQSAYESGGFSCVR